MNKRNKIYVITLAGFLVLFWIIYDFGPLRCEKFQKVYEYSFEDKSIREVSASMTSESRRMTSQKDEKDQIIGFVNIIERIHYLLYHNETTLDTYYDFIDNILYPKQKNNLKNKAQYTHQVDKYLKRIRKTDYVYLKYEVSEPEFYYENFARNATVSVVRITGGKRVFLTYSFRKFKGRYYLYLK